MKAECAHFFTGKSFLVLGLAKSGLAVSKLLTRLGAKVTVNEQKERESCPQAEELEGLGIELICGGHPLDLLDKDWFMLVKNPGIPLDHPFLIKAEERKIPIVTEVEIAYLISEAPIIALTGSNGKTTTTTLVYEMLKASDLNPCIAGNIGTVFCEVAEKAKQENWIVAELSSFQLLGTRQFRPEIAVFLNIFDAHLDYHRTKEHYVQAKKKIFTNQGREHLTVLNYDQPELREFSLDLPTNIFWFSMKDQAGNTGFYGSYIRDNMIMYQGKEDQAFEVLPIEEVKLIGQHNLENILAAISTSVLAGAKLAGIQQVLRTFTGVAHRLQWIGDLKGVHYYNDSKATNGLATMKALQSFNQQVILIAGGLDRGEDFLNLTEVFKAKVKCLIVYGEIAAKISKVAKEAGVKEIIFVHNVKEAVSSVAELAQKGDIVLLSPAAASWDQFASFEERGDMFTQLVHMLR